MKPLLDLFLHVNLSGSVIQIVQLFARIVKKYNILSCCSWSSRILGISMYLRELGLKVWNRLCVCTYVCVREGKKDGKKDGGTEGEVDCVIVLLPGLLD